MDHIRFMMGQPHRCASASGELPSVDIQVLLSRLRPRLIICGASVTQREGLPS
ncbi:hypothetical protein BDZ97DRAFT_1774636 [Flammula alnicola]|nr:hypothetical protein BDZ97DRAFT_1774636 [Flammula alnicola]